ncbi:MAG: Soluble aldose sugar dehydrogenase YliI precursor [Candidatus Heimdallarchaeota archaeon LC_2]|nr:MAG: Soluble aldose sugar dehydrogenase YliI precursor [Candidatus Heimdallarchaeota archaeon LC_2]
MTSMVFAAFYFGYIGGSAKYAQGVVYPNTGFDFPINYIEPNDDTNRVFILEQKGKVMVFDKNDAGNSKAALDLGKRSNFHYDWEGGLLGITFSPQFSIDKYVYIFYTVNDTSRHKSVDNCDPCVNSTISRFTIDRSDSNKINESSELKILKIPQFRSWHRGGQLNFGPDGNLFINVGDSLQGGDDLTDFYGKILRVDVNTQSNGLNYSIPLDNPFVGNLEGYREEIYAYGLRNPWRGSFDTLTSTFWVGDVGLDSWEEINVVESGKNYGWPYVEGIECTQNHLDCNMNNYTGPVLAYPHQRNSSDTFLDKILGNSDEINDPIGTAIIGGFVYRGSDFPDLVGKYIFADYTGIVWALSYDFISKSFQSTEFLTRFPETISSIGEGTDGELFFTGHILGYIYRLRYLADAIVTFLLLVFIALSGSILISTIWIGFKLKGRVEPINYKTLIKPILKRSLIIFVIILILIGLSFLLRLIFYSIYQRES